MEKFILIFSLLLIPFFTLAHSGGTDELGGHHCWTDCEAKGYKTGAFHYHSGPYSGLVIEDGALVRAKGDIDVYIVKNIGNKKFKRLVLSPHVFESYGHLRWEDVMDLDQVVVDSFATSDLVRATVAGDPRVYQLYPQGDTGEKRWITTGEAFERLGHDWDAVYTINETDRDAYAEGTVIE
ncbi:MAG: hypothetical protein WD712_00240 [Candidatus Spechtbacterales bacterium]